MIRMPVVIAATATLVVGIAIAATIAHGIVSVPAVRSAAAGSASTERRFDLGGASRVRIVCDSVDVHVVPAADATESLRVNAPLRPAVTMAFERTAGLATLTLRQTAGSWSFRWDRDEPVVIAFDERHPTTIVTDSGDVTVDAARAPLEIQSRSGDLTVRDPAAMVTVRSNSGDLRASGVGGPLAVRTSSGDVDATLARGWSGERIGIVTSSGDVILHVPASFRAALRTSTSSGDVHNDAGLPAALAGAPTISAATASGDITVR